MSTLTVPDAFVVQISGGDQGSLTFNEHADLILSNPSRSSSGRALVAAGGNQLIINWASDFTGGVAIAGQVQLPNLSEVPPGVTTDIVRVDAAGNLYRAD